MLQAFSEFKSNKFTAGFPTLSNYYPAEDMSVTNSCVIFMKSIIELTIQLQITGHF